MMLMIFHCPQQFCHHACCTETFLASSLHLENRFKVAVKAHFTHLLGESLLKWKQSYSGPQTSPRHPQTWPCIPTATHTDTAGLLRWREVGWELHKCTNTSTLPSSPPQSLWDNLHAMFSWIVCSFASCTRSYVKPAAAQKSKAHPCWPLCGWPLPLGLSGESWALWPEAADRYRGQPESLPGESGPPWGPTGRWRQTNADLQRHNRHPSGNHVTNTLYGK